MLEGRNCREETLAATGSKGRNETAAQLVCGFVVRAKSYTRPLGRVQPRQPSLDGFFIENCSCQRLAAKGTCIKAGGMPHEGLWMAVKIVIDKKNAWLHCHGECSEDELIAASNRMLDLSDGGYYFPQNPFFLPGKKRFRQERRRDCARECARLEELGLEALDDTPRRIRLADGRLVAWRADWEYLNRRRYTFALHRVHGRVMYLPLQANGELLEKLTYAHLRCLTGDSQSFLEKWAYALPGAPEYVRRHGKRFAVNTIEFFSHYNDPLYPVMRLHRDPFNPFPESAAMAVRLMP